MPRPVLDASAFLASFYREAGAEEIEALLPQARISAVNWSEVAAKLVDRGTPADRVAALLERDEVALNRLRISKLRLF